MKDYQRQFIQFAMQKNALKFGEFTLKSGRKSPYFFNAGTFSTGNALAQLARFYAAAIVDSGIQYDMLFGPAYKGIPLVAAVSMALAEHHDIDVPWAFNRKEAKDHGEGGWVVGAPLKGKVLVIDDVITAGTAIREVAAMFEHVDASMCGVVVALDRQEKGQNELSAIQEVEKSLAIPVASIVGLRQIISYLEETSQKQQVVAMDAYRQKYGTQ